MEFGGVFYLSSKYLQLHLCADSDMFLPTIPQRSDVVLLHAVSNKM